MKTLRWAAVLLFAGVLVVPALTDDPKKEDKKEEGFVPMFDGKTLKGWVNVNCYPGTFFVKDDMIITTGKPTGFLRTEKQYENFIAEFDWMHIPPAPGEVGNSGFFVWADPLPAVGSGYTRGIEVQVLVNLTYKNKKGEITATSQGDLFSIWGAKCVPDRPHPNGSERCLPSEDRCKGANEWNHYRVEANDGVIKLAVNGKVVSGVSKCSPRKGYLALESEGSECRFRNLKIKELPSTDPKPAEIADVAKDFTNLLTGTDLPGWKVGDDEAKKNWKTQDWMLHFTNAIKDKGQILRSEKTYGDCEFIADFRFPEKEGKTCTFRFGGDDVTKALSVIIGPDGSFGAFARGGFKGSTKHLKPVKEWNRLRVTIKDGKTALELNGENETPTEGINAPSEKGSITLGCSSEMDFGNLFVRPLK
jgi:3-keto-disaccharide hydrolase